MEFGNMEFGNMEYQNMEFGNMEFDWTVGTNTDKYWVCRDTLHQIEHFEISLSQYIQYSTLIEIYYRIFLLNLCQSWKILYLLKFLLSRRLPTGSRIILMMNMITLKRMINTSRYYKSQGQLILPVHSMRKLKLSNVLIQLSFHIWTQRN